MQSDESENIRHPTKNIESFIFRRKKREAEGGGGSDDPQYWAGEPQRAGWSCTHRGHLAYCPSNSFEEEDKNVFETHVILLASA